ncbi:MAG: hypothetical protein V3V94_03925 [Candidatus Brocadiales bacterium]
MNAALFAAMFTTLIAAKSQEEGMAEADSTGKILGCGASLRYLGRDQRRGQEGA